MKLFGGECLHEHSLMTSKFFHECGISGLQLS